VTALFQTAARVWLTLALCSFALPADRRAGTWLPLHLAVAGALSTAIAGAMPNFVGAMTATPGPAPWIVRLRFGLLTVGVGVLAFGVPSRTAWAVAAGGSAFIVSMAMLAASVARAWRVSLVRRHGALVAGYGFALACILVGGSFGALVGSRAITGEAILRAVRAHAVLNVLGFVSVTIVGTLVTFVPTLLRVRMPARRSAPVLAAAAAGVVLLAAGVVGGWPWPVRLGAWAFAAAAVGAGSVAVEALRTPRTFAIPTAAMHVGAGLAWFVGGSVALAVASNADGSLDAARDWFTLVFVAGWAVQVLLGAWSYLLPMAVAGHPDDRRRWLAVGEVGGRTQVVLGNIGLILVLGDVQGWAGPTAGGVGAVLAFAAAAAALVRAWAFRWLARVLPAVPGRAVEVWG
jgi:nitrite reductase (NO-forming)